MSDLVPTEHNFEDFRNENGMTFWWASDFMKMLGYSEMRSFEKVLNRATKALVSLEIPHYENIVPHTRELPDGTSYQDFKLTRFACYLAAMNGDPKIREVAEAQRYFVEQTRRFELFITDSNELERLAIRDDLTEGNKSLASTAKSKGVFNYANFQDAGYRGLYNMRAGELMARRGIPRSVNLADVMGRSELAANLFRVTQTEERIKSQNVRGQGALEDTHFRVGREVREMVQRNTGRDPENLPQEKRLPKVKSELRSGYRQMKKLDTKKK